MAPMGNLNNINWHNSGSTQDRVAIFDSGVFGDALFNGITKIFPRMTPVATATKFGTKSAITRLI